MAFNSLWIDIIRRPFLVELPPPTPRILLFTMTKIDDSSHRVPTVVRIGKCCRFEVRLIADIGLVSYVTRGDRCWMLNISAVTVPE